jgi:hypothetical protein
MSSTTPTHAFVHDPLTKIIGRPTLQTIQKMQAETYANLFRIHSDAGGGAHGHVAIIMSPAEFLVLTNVAWVAPAYPGPDPAPAPTAATVVEATRVHARDMANFHLYNQLVQRTSSLILACVDEVYYKVLFNNLSSYSHLSPWELINHLTTTYGVVADEDLTANKNRLSADWNCDEPIETLWTRTVQCIRFAADNAMPIADREVCITIVTVLHKSGVFTLDLRDWANLTPAGRTFAAMQVFFNDRDKQRRQNKTTETAGYHGAHAVTPTKPVATVANAPTTPPPSSSTGGSTSVLPAGAVVAYYCWSCGIGFSKNHTSGNCIVPKEGHVKQAILNNRMGGYEGFQVTQRAQQRATTGN